MLFLPAVLHLLRRVEMSVVQKVYESECFPVSGKIWWIVFCQYSRKLSVLCKWLGATAADYPENMLSVLLSTWEMVPKTIFCFVFFCKRLGSEFFICFRQHRRDILEKSICTDRYSPTEEREYVLFLSFSDPKVLQESPVISHIAVFIMSASNNANSEPLC